MNVGYGRGYYGVGQLAPRPQRPRTSNWAKIALVVGVGAIVWFMWPRSKLYDPEAGRVGDEPKPPPPSLPPPLEGQLQLPPPSTALVAEGLPPPQLTQEAVARGFPSQQAYEDAVVASARQLRETGAMVMLAPHLQHLTARLGPGSRS